MGARAAASCGVRERRSGFGRTTPTRQILCQILQTEELGLLDQRDALELQGPRSGDNRRLARVRMGGHRPVRAGHDGATQGERMGRTSLHCYPQAPGQPVMPAGSLPRCFCARCSTTFCPRRPASTGCARSSDTSFERSLGWFALPGAGGSTSPNPTSASAGYATPPSSWSDCSPASPRSPLKYARNGHWAGCPAPQPRKIY